MSGRALREPALVNHAPAGHGPAGFDPARGSLDYRISWPRPATPCDLVPLWAGEFCSFGDWVNFATTRLTGTYGSGGNEVSAICVDALGRRCAIGKDFNRARDEGAFPVRYFWECVPRDTDRSGEADETPQAAQPKARAGAEGIAQDPSLNQDSSNG